jgi:superfamily II DNA or RNA helicase
MASSPEAKIALYMDLFRCRMDIFATRWESAWRGTSGWSPEYAGGRFQQGFNKRLTPKVPLTPQVIEAHLRGVNNRFVGLYPLLDNNTCHWLAADFDGTAAMLDALAYLKTARSARVPAALEISQSGRGAHVWIFFTEAILAAKARAMGAVLMHDAIKQRGAMNLTSYDRFFPSQDVLPQGGVGNLIAAPLYKRRVEDGLTVFLDPATLEPYEDQWSFLSTLGKMSPAEVTNLARLERYATVGTGVTQVERSRATKVHPRMAPVVHANLKSGLEVDMADLAPESLSTLKHASSLVNPKFYELMRLRKSTYGTPRFIQGYNETLQNTLVVPRGLRAMISDIVTASGSRLEVIDEREGGTEIEVILHTTLRDEQAEAVGAMLAHDDGVLVAPPGTGKTVMACAIIAERAVSTVVLVNRKALADQWRARITEFLGIKAGQYGGGRRKLTGVVDIAMLPSLARAKDVAGLLAGYGQVIVDECHNVAAPAYDYAMKAVSAHYWLGLTATPRRRDKLDEVVWWQLGPVRHTLGESVRGTLADITGASPTVGVRELTIHETSFVSGEVDPLNPAGMAALADAMVRCDERNAQIVADVDAALLNGRNCVVATTRRAHVDILVALLAERGHEALVLRGSMKSREVREVVTRLNEAKRGSGILLVATTQFVGEGFDAPALDTLFLAAPISWQNTLLQVAGRILRPADPGKTAIAHDYVDAHSPILAARFPKRLPGYRALGFTKPGGARL